MILSDAPLLGLIAALAFAPTGPVGVVTCAAAGVHFLHPAFRPRIQLVSAYVALPVALAAVLWGGLFGATAPPTPFSAGLVFLVAVAVAFDWVFPGVQSLPVSRGSLKTACATLHVQLPLADFILRVYYPSRPTAAAKRLPYLIHGSGSTSGLATFMRMPSILFDWLRYVSAPVFLADPDEAMLASPEDVAAATRGAGVVVESAGRASPRDLPVVVFSHGLGGMPGEGDSVLSGRELGRLATPPPPHTHHHHHRHHAPARPDCYISSVISEWVSRGYVVFAPEHADGSAAFTAFPDGYRVPYIPLTPEQRRDRSLEFKRRHAQVKHRAREVSACIDVAEAAAAYVLPAPGHEDDEKDDSRDLLFIKLLLCDRIDLSRGVCAVGCVAGRNCCPLTLCRHSDSHFLQALVRRRDVFYSRRQGPSYPICRCARCMKRGGSARGHAAPPGVLLLRPPLPHNAAMDVSAVVAHAPAGPPRHASPLIRRRRVLSVARKCLCAQTSPVSPRARVLAATARWRVCCSINGCRGG